MKQSGEVSLIVDETKDVSKMEQISIVLRYYHGDSVKESFLKFLSTDKLDAGNLTNAILSCLEKFGVDYKSNIVDQNYDGALVISGKNSDAAARIKELCPTALHIHCYVHRLNLVVMDTTKSVPEAADFFARTSAYLYVRFICSQQMENHAT